MTKPYYQDKWVTIYHGDCREILPELPDNSVDLGATSPPYNTGGDFHTMVAGKRVTYGAYPSFNDCLPEKDYQCFILDVLAKIYRCLKLDGSLMLNMKNRVQDFTLISPIPLILASPFILKQDINVNFHSSPNTDKVRFYPVCERLYWLVKDKKAFKFNDEMFTLSDDWHLSRDSNRTESGHLAIFPEVLPLNCIRACSESNDLILDPFLGSGTTCYCAKKLGRHSIGIEIEEKYCEIAANRCRQGVFEFSEPLSQLPAVPPLA